MRRLLWALVVVLAVAVAAGCSEAPSATTPTSTTTSSAATSAGPATDPCDAPGLRPLEGFSEVVVRVTPPAGPAQQHCALLAADRAAHQQGLMEQTDLRGYAGMVFRFETPVEAGFYMRNTRIPLSIAFYDADGRFVSSADMAPCPDDVEDCPTYGADGPYLHAVEVAQGDLARLGMVPGSVLSFP